MSLHEISRILKVSRNTVRMIVQKGGAEQSEKESKYVDHVPMIKALFKECCGNVVRVAEELDSRHKLLIPYQTLTWIIRKFEIRTPKKTRSGEYDFAPGEEMQHDTSPHKLVLGGEKITAQCASLVLAYSRKIFIQVLCEIQWVIKFQLSAEEVNHIGKVAEIAEAPSAAFSQLHFVVNAFQNTVRYS